MWTHKPAESELNLCASSTGLLTKFQELHLCKPTDECGVAQVSLREQCQDNGAAQVSVTGANLACRSFTTSEMWK